MTPTKLLVTTGSSSGGSIGWVAAPRATNVSLQPGCPTAPMRGFPVISIPALKPTAGTAAATERRLEASCRLQPQSSPRANRWSRPRPDVGSPGTPGPGTTPLLQEQQEEQRQQQRQPKRPPSRPVAPEIPGPAPAPAPVAVAVGFTSAKKAAAAAGPAAPTSAADPLSQLACQHFGSCSGCSLQDGLAAPPLYGEAAEFFRGLGLAHVPAVMKATHGWRCRAKLAVRGSAGRPLIGLFREGSHDCVDIVGTAPLATTTATTTTAATATTSSGSAVATVGRAGASLAAAARRGSGRGRAAVDGASAGGGSGAAGGGGPVAGRDAGWGEAGCRAHHPRINQAAALIKQLITQLRVAPYNEPPATATRGRPPRGPPTRSAARAATGASRAAEEAVGSGPGPGPGSGSGCGPESDPGLLRYLQLTAVPSLPGTRAEEDPAAAVVQVVLVVNAPPDCAAADPRVAPVLQLCRLLWSIAGPGGPMAPAAEDTQHSGPAAAAGGGASAAGGGGAAGGGAASAASAAGGGGGAAAAAAVAAAAAAGGGTAAAAAAAAGRLVTSPQHGPGGAVTAVTNPSRPPPLVHSIWLNFQPEASCNTILGQGWMHVAGPAAAWQDFGGVAACVGPGSFVQANYAAMQLVLREIAGMVPEGSRVTELHAGIGVIGLSLAERRRLAALRCVELNPAAATPFWSSLALLERRQQRRQGGLQPPVHPAGGAGSTLPSSKTDHSDLEAGPPHSAPATSNCQLPAGGPSGPTAAAAATEFEYITAEAGSDPARFLSGCDVLVVDPPRKGLGQSLLAALTRPTSALVEAVEPHVAAAAAAPDAAVPPPGSCTPAAAASDLTCLHPPSLPSRLVYLSCGFRALQGDLAALLAGGWRLRSATAYLFFPGTDSLETLVLLTRGQD